MTAPVRLRLSRAKGFDLQAHSLATNGLPAFNVARPSIFGNPFKVGQDGTRAECVDWFDAMLDGMIRITGTDDPEDQAIRQAAIIGTIGKLTGKNLACWCALDGKPCHADTLLQLANDPVKIDLCRRISCAEVKS